MLKNFQRYFRFYLASFLFGLLLVGIRWQVAPLGEAELTKEATTAAIPASQAAHPVGDALAVR